MCSPWIDPGLNKQIIKAIFGTIGGNLNKDLVLNNIRK